MRPLAALALALCALTAGCAADPATSGWSERPSGSATAPVDPEGDQLAREVLDELTAPPTAEEDTRAAELIARFGPREKQPGESTREWCLRMRDLYTAVGPNTTLRACYGPGGVNYLAPEDSAS